jgi:hypothetical protein
MPQLTPKRCSEHSTANDKRTRAFSYGLVRKFICLLLLSAGFRLLAQGNSPSGPGLGTTTYRVNGISYVVGPGAGVAGSDPCVQINSAIRDLPNVGGLVEVTGFQGPLTCKTTISISKPIKLLVIVPLVMSTANPVIEVTNRGSGTTIEGLALLGTEFRYTGSEAADILRCGSPLDVNISCGYLTLQDVSFMPMEGSAAIIDVHAYNPYFIQIERVRGSISECTGGLKDTSHTQQNCGTGRAIGGSSNIAAKFEVNAGSKMVPPGGSIKISGWAHATGRGADNLQGTSKGLWFKGLSGTKQGLSNITLEGYGDAEGTNVSIQSEYTSLMSVGAGWLISGGTGYKSIASHRVSFYGSQFQNASTEHYNIDGESYDIAFINASLSVPATLGTDKGNRTLKLFPGIASGEWDLSAIPVRTGNLSVTGNVTASLPATFTAGGAPGWNKYTLTKVGGKWVITGEPSCGRCGGGPATTSKDQDFVITAIGANAMLMGARLTPKVACTGTDTARISVGVSGNNSVTFRNVDIKAAPSSSNFATAGPTNGQFNNNGNVNLTASITTTGGNVNDIADGCTVVLDIAYVNLP